MGMDMGNLKVTVNCCNLFLDMPENQEIPRPKEIKPRETIETVKGIKGRGKGKKREIYYPVENGGKPIGQKPEKSEQQYDKKGKIKMPPEIGGIIDVEE